MEACRKIGEQGVRLIEAIAKNKKATVNILTHCNAGWLACIDWGSATAPIYQAFNKGIDIHIWVTETRPRNQGASLTAWELGQHKVPHTVVVDSAGLENRWGRKVLLGSNPSLSAILSAECAVGSVE